MNGDTAVLTGSPTFTTAAGPASAPGAYSITAGVGTLAAANYTFAFATGTLTVTPVPPPPVRYTAAAAGSGSGAIVVYDAAWAEVRRFQAFEDGFTGGARVATADVTGDGIDDVVVGAGPGGASVVKAYDGATGELFAALTAFEAAYASNPVNSEKFSSQDSAAGSRTEAAAGAAGVGTTADGVGTTADDWQSSSGIRTALAIGSPATPVAGPRTDNRATRVQGPKRIRMTQTVSIVSII
ncbi:hypothetical protein PX52LOC_04768 [Limnoglobus roseus]|uniref:MBG domain-containing protein n=1 Tax=Limnoglobus roseus TaxID=2598579 RepID=A0A5C1AJ78_9BACT|nr:hypothetical protein PX52LOC_04768 [Limnoglobus roseus]